MPGRSQEAKARLFIAHLREVIGDVPYWDLAIHRAGAQAPARARARGLAAQPAIAAAEAAPRAAASGFTRRPRRSSISPRAQSCA